MEVITSPIELQNILAEKKKKQLSVGFVPTMGALHSGHLSLVDQSISQNNITVLSIFVNPTQFNNLSDFEKYPRTLESDIQLLNNRPVDYIFAPHRSELYPDNYNYSVVEIEKNKVLCGETRPGHFQGVLTIILKLIHITQADRLYLGEKDYQQLEIIRGMAKAFFISTQIIGCPTVRDDAGLALSSRNQRLTPSGLQKAQRFAQLLKEPTTLNEVRKNIETENIKIDYLEELWGRRFAAVFIDDVRLIDNVSL